MREIKGESRSRRRTSAGFGSATKPRIVTELMRLSTTLHKVLSHYTVSALHSSTRHSPAAFRYNPVPLQLTQGSGNSVARF